MRGRGGGLFSDNSSEKLFYIICGYYCEISELSLLTSPVLVHATGERIQHQWEIYWGITFLIHGCYHNYGIIIYYAGYLHKVFFRFVTLHDISCFLYHADSIPPYLDTLGSEGAHNSELSVTRRRPYFPTY